MLVHAPNFNLRWLGGLLLLLLMGCPPSDNGQTGLTDQEIKDIASAELNVPAENLDILTRDPNHFPLEWPGGYFRETGRQHQPGTI